MTAAPISSWPTWAEDMAPDPGSKDIVVFRSKGGGAFETISRPAEGSPQALVLADLDADGRLDAVTPDYEGHVSVFRGRGNGEFDDPATWPIGTTPGASGVTAADLDGDGHLDLATANSLVGRGSSDHTVTVLLGHGDGTFAEPRVYQTGGAQPITVVAADFDEDGRPDLATPNGFPATDVSVLFARAGGGFSEPVKHETGPVPHSVVTADIDDDGHADLATGSFSGPPVTVLFGRGDGTFERTDVSGGGTPVLIAAAGDIDGDRRVDLILLHLGSGQLRPLFNTGGR